MQSLDALDGHLPPPRRRVVVMAAERYEVYEDEAGEWRWRLVAGNNEIVAVGESYTRRDDAVRACETAAKVAASAAGDIRVL